MPARPVSTLLGFEPGLVLAPDDVLVGFAAVASGSPLPCARQLPRSTATRTPMPSSSQPTQCGRCPVAGGAVGLGAGGASATSATSATSGVSTGGLALPT